ncbi:Fluoroacetyl-CoA thioesterase [Hyphomicrobiales bacterium]|nr:Fluoroacetyl-CoA thioesterase [Hyphomicrobiales bacterium]CAH1689303.1 Fluoroacetyl-CoA thioesterase [Hyphomicrobiales bacterium]
MSEHKSTFVVTPEMSAEQHGNAGFPVLATPALLGLFEKAAIAAMADRLSAGEGSVGTGASLQHLAATPLGQTVTITARITATEGKRVSFTLEAHDEQEKIGTCTHERFVVDIARFVDRLAKKSPAPSNQ